MPPHNRIALVTGSSRGIGRSIALALASSGCHVAVNCHQQAAAAEEVRAAIEKLGRRAVAIQADVSVPADVERLVSETEHLLGEVEILVNNAGIAQTKPIADITLEDWERMLRVNLTSAFLVTQRVLPAMRKRRWGRIINLSSVAAQTGGVIGPHYATSKAGLIGLTHSYAALLAKEGITANAIAPALLETDMVTGNPQASTEKIPLGYFGHPDEAGRAAVLLAESDYITGQTLNLNGGWYMS
jgi:3-oxoacyl-[acyl-carrier protein] reductase